MILNMSRMIIYVALVASLASRSGQQDSTSPHIYPRAGNEGRCTVSKHIGAMEIIVMITISSLTLHFKCLVLF